MKESTIFLLDILNLIKLYNKEIILFLLIICLICFIKIYIEFIKTSRILNAKSKILKHQELLRKQQLKNTKIINILKDF